MWNVASQSAGVDKEHRSSINADVTAVIENARVWILLCVTMADIAS